MSTRRQLLARIADLEAELRATRQELATLAGEVKVGDTVRFLAQVMNRNGDIRNPGDEAVVTVVHHNEDGKATHASVQWGLPRFYMRPLAGGLGDVPVTAMEVVSV